MKTTTRRSNRRPSKLTTAQAAAVAALVAEGVPFADAVESVLDTTNYDA